MTDLPEPRQDNTEMVARVIEQALLFIHAVEPISNADVMSAAMHVLVDAGMDCVVKGEITREKLVEDICDAARRMVSQWTPGGDRGALQ